MKTSVVVALIFIAVIVVYRSAYPSVTVRYRLTLEAQVDGEPKTGSGVVEVTYSKLSQFISQNGLVVDVSGEAVVLDLGSRGTLFALLKEDTDSRSGPEWLVLRAFNFSGGSLPRPVEDGVEQVRRLSGKRDLPLTSLPMLVRFRDVRDPLTVERVDPLELSKSFGAGANLSRATLEMVPAAIWPFDFLGIFGVPVTTGIVRRLPWLERLKGGYLDGAFAGGGAALSNALYGGNFKRGS